jgi:hypothetical protein
MLLHAPEIVFLLGLVLGRRDWRKVCRAVIASRERTARVIAHGRSGGLPGFYAAWRNAVIFPIGLANERQQLMIMHVLDFVR